MRDDGHDSGRDVERLLRHLDHPMPRVRAEDVAARARGTGEPRQLDGERDADPIPRRTERVVGGRTPRRDPGRPWRRVAAALVLLMGLSGLAYAAPGSPLPGWIGSAARWLGGQDPARSVEAPPEGSGGGVQLDPDQPLRVEVRPSGPGGHAVVSLTDEARVTVRIPPGAGALTSEPTRLIVDLAAPDTVRIGLPRTTRRLELTSGGRTLFLKVGPDVTTASPRRPGGDWVIPLGPGG